MSLREELLGAFETHSVEEIKACINAGLDVNQPIAPMEGPEPNEGWIPINALIMMYLRSEQFSNCLQALVDAGAKYPSKPVLAVLLGNDSDLESCIKEDPSVVQAKYSIPYPFTATEEVSLLHICAEFNKVNCARILLKRGADVNATAAVDQDGLGGHTPIFHTVNSHDNFAFPMLEFLLENGASLDVHLKGLIWGRYQEWETYIPEVNPISYAMMGNLRQFQRRPEHIAQNIELMQKYKYGKPVKTNNVPNAYIVRSKEQRKRNVLRWLDW